MGEDAKDYGGNSTGAYENGQSAEIINFNDSNTGKEVIESNAESDSQDKITQSEAFADFQKALTGIDEKSEKYKESLQEEAQEKLAAGYIAEQAAIAAKNGAIAAAQEIASSGLVKQEVVDKQIKKFGHNMAQKIKTAIIYILVGAGITGAGIIGTHIANDKKNSEPTDPATTEEATTGIDVDYGDTAWGIVKAANPGASDQEIQSILNQSEKLNPGMDLNNLSPDDTLNIPAPTTEPSSEVTAN